MPIRHRASSVATGIVVAVALAIFGSSLLWTPHISAQAIPSLTVTPGPVPASECTTAPLPEDFLGILVQTPVPGEPYVAPTAVPAGSPPDPQTAAEITASIRQFVACYNTGETLRVLALWDSAYIRRLFDPEGKLPPDTADEIVKSIAKAAPPKDDELLVLIAIHTIVQLPDGRVAAVVETDGGDPNPDGTEVDLFFFSKVDDRWLVSDAVKNIDEVQAPPTPTPTS